MTPAQDTCCQQVWAAVLSAGTPGSTHSCICAVAAAVLSHTQEQGLDTVDANRALGLPDDCREYTSVRNILRDLKVESIQLMVSDGRGRAGGWGGGTRQQWQQWQQQRADATTAAAAHTRLHAAVCGYVPPTVAWPVLSACLPCGGSCDHPQTNNPRKMDVLTQLGVKITGRIPCQVQAGQYNEVGGERDLLRGVCIGGGGLSVVAGLIEQAGRQAKGRPGAGRVLNGGAGLWLKPGTGSRT